MDPYGCLCFKRPIGIQRQDALSRDVTVHGLTPFRLNLVFLATTTMIPDAEVEEFLLEQDRRMNMSDEDSDEYFSRISR
jgi:hypothetical protein